ncbi:MAG: DMT family transporter [Flavobacteriales bacterium]
MDKKGTYLAHLALFAVAAIYGANYVIAKGLMPDLIGPSGFIVYRVIGALALFGTLYALNFERVQSKDLIRLLFCGLTGVAVNQLMFFNGLNLTSPVHASIIMTVNPILVLIMSALILKNAITARKVLGIVVGTIGAVLLLLLSSTSNSAHVSVIGDAMVLVNAASYAVYLVIVKPLMSKYKPTTVIFYTFLCGALFVIPVGLNQALEVDWSLFTQRDTGALLYVIIATTFMAYLLNVYALKRVQPTVVSVYIYLQPLMAGLSAFAFAMLGWEDYTGDINLKTVGSALLIFIGVYLVSFKRKTQIP